MESAQVAKVVLVLVAAVALAWLLSHPKVRALEERTGISVLFAAGIPFLLLGFILSRPAVGVLTPQVIADLRPAFEFGMGWLGFAVGVRFDMRRLDRVPGPLAPATALQAAVPMLTTAVISWLVLSALGVVPGQGLVHDVLALTACAAASAPLPLSIAAMRAGADRASLVSEMTLLDDGAAMAGLFALSIYFRPAVGATGWNLPASGWVLLSLGLAALLGVVTWALVEDSQSESEQLALLLGCVALAAGTAGYLALSSPAICAVAGALLANLPMRDPARLTRILEEVEQPLYLVFLLVAGTLWKPLEWEGWAVAMAYAYGRIYGKDLAARALSKLLGLGAPEKKQLSLALIPQSPVTVVVIISALTLAPDKPAIAWAIHAIIVGGALTGLFVRLARASLEAAP